MTRRLVPAARLAHPRVLLRSALNTRAHTADLHPSRYAPPSLALALGFAQALIPSVLISILFGFKVWCPVALLMLPLARLRPGTQVALRLLYVLASAVGLLHAWNITVYTLPFYFRFLTLDSLPWSAAQLGIGALALLAFLWPLPRQVGRSRGALWLAAGAAFFIAAKAGPWQHELPYVSTHIRSPALRMAYDLVDAGRGIARDRLLDRRAGVQPPAVPTHTFDSSLRGLAALPDKLLLVVVESWSEDEAGLRAMQGALAGLGVPVRGAGYEGFRGSTLPGELRELCSEFVSLGRFEPGGSETANCAPARLRDAGYRTVAIHGYIPAFYLRGDVWRDLGFEQRWFRERIPHDRPCAGPFPGVCDSQALAFGLQRLAEPGRQFVYVLTLSSHEPVSAPAADRPCTLFAKLPVATPSQRIARQSICHLATGLRQRPELAGAYVYVVGDHAPPSIAQTGLVPRGRVPWLVLAP